MANSTRRHPRARILLATTALLLLFASVAALILAHNIQPLLKASVVDALEERFHSPVELDTLTLSLVRGIEVRGSGLRILHLAGPAAPDKLPHAPPMLSVANFAFRTSLRDLMLRRARIAHIDVTGMEIHIPPHSKLLAPAANAPHHGPQIDFVVGRIYCRNVLLLIETDQPGKDPLRFEIPSLDLTDVGPNRPMLYVADVLNPRPRGNVHAFGHVGPWAGAEPRATPIDGVFTFTQVDLSTIHGLSGTLAATGQFAGQLGQLSVDASTSVPDFALDTSAHPLPLLVQVHALVDGTTGDTTLAPARATLGHSPFTATGTIVRLHPPGGSIGHDIALTIQMPHGRIEDLLALSSKTIPPALHGDVALDTHLHIPPGRQRIAQKIQLAGSLTIQNVAFTNPSVQQRVDGYSLRAQGRPEDIHFDHASANSQMTVAFALANTMMTIDSLHYAVPGAQVQLAGAYSLDAATFEFKGRVRTDAKASQMVTGWKSLLLMPFDRMLAKNGAGVELPISITGTGRDPHFSLALEGADEPASAMAHDLRSHPTH